MPCQITITNVQGQRQGSALVSVQVDGTATECQQVDVILDCRVGEALLQTAVVTNRLWSVVFRNGGNPDLSLAQCSCDPGQIRVVVECHENKDCNATLQYQALPCLDVCPQVVNPQAVVDGCNPDGTVNVTFSATVSPGAGAGPAPTIVEWNYGTQYSGAQTVTTHNQPLPAFTARVPGDGLMHTAYLSVTWPEHCPSVPVTFTAPDCGMPGCPDVTWEPTQGLDGACDETGARVVTFRAQVTPHGQTQTTAVLIDDSTGLIRDQNTSSAMFVLSGSTSYTPGVHTVHVEITQPAGCGNSTNSITVPECMGSQGCPQIDIEIGKESDCGSNLNRSVTVTATVTPAAGTPTGAELMFNAMRLDSKSNQNMQFQLQGTQIFPAGMNTVAVNVTAPPGCQGKTATFNVSPCAIPPPPPSQPPSDDSGGGWGCLIGRWAVALLLGLALFLFLVAACIPGVGPEVAIAGGVALGLALIVLAIWLWLCGNKCGFLILLWQVFGVAALVALYLSGCCLLATILAAGFGLLSIVLFFVWRAICKPSVCVALREITATFVIGAGTAFDWLTHLAAACGLAWVPVASASIGVVLTAITLAKCTSSSGGGGRGAPMPMSLTRSQRRPRMPQASPALHRVRLPRFFVEEEIGLGDVIRKTTYAMGIKPCGGCEKRAAALNGWLHLIR
ncbi:MAG TPA: hypothetical protein VKV15_19380 [Bryobacteraceae bacterium]|nr:hypothetical protein [Bryobacteraceae bacterium]